jgi:hypothetical protein
MIDNILFIMYGFLFNAIFIFFLLLIKYKNWFEPQRYKIRFFLDKQTDFVIIFIIITIISSLFIIARYITN